MGCTLSLVRILRAPQKQLFQRSSSCHKVKEPFFGPHSFLNFWQHLVQWITSSFLNTFFSRSLQHLPFLFLIKPRWMIFLRTLCWVLFSTQTINAAFPPSSDPGWWLRLPCNCQLLPILISGSDWSTQVFIRHFHLDVLRHLESHMSRMRFWVSLCLVLTPFKAPQLSEGSCI